MNNKGLTLVEVLAVLIILSVIATIAVPNIAGNIKGYKRRLTDAQLSTIEGATKSWVTDNIGKVDCNGVSALAISFQTLSNKGYLDNDMKNPNGADFDDAFGLVYCTTIKDETGNLANYNYEYGAYASLDDYYEKMAIKYAISENQTVDFSIGTDDLKSKNYIYSTINMFDDEAIKIENKTINVEVNQSVTGEYEYEATVN